MQPFTIPCDNCAADCCRKYLVNVNAYDVFRIAGSLRTPIADFAELRWLTEAERDYRILLDTSARESERRHHRITLRRVPDPDPAHDTRCVFLVTVGTRGRCGIYSLRPGVCATYPTSLDGGLIGLDGGGKYCPPGGWQLAGIDVPAFRLQHRGRKRHDLVHDALVDAWNARILAASEAWSEQYFFHYVLNAYRDLETRMPSLFDDEAPAPAAIEIAHAVSESLRAIGWT